MGYFDTINELKEALNSYSEENEKLSDLYNNAIKAAEQENQKALQSLEQQYNLDRNEIYADTAREERNFFNLLASRGLGFSGEAAQAKLNSNITLSNRLGELLSSKNDTEKEYSLDLANKMQEINLSNAEKQRALNEQKNAILSDIAALELDKEQQDAALAADKEKLNAQLTAEREQWEAELKAEQELQAEKLKAERDMLYAELAARYGNDSSALGGSGSSSSSSSGSGNKTEPEIEETLSGYIPNVSAKDLAKLMVSNATDGSNLITSKKEDYLINKYLLEMKENYNIDSDYYNDLVFMLKAYGYESTDIEEMRVSVISYDADTYYDDMYDRYYNQYAIEGMSEGNARQHARQQARYMQFNYIYTHTDSKIEFLKCCQKLGISENEAAEYASYRSWSNTSKDSDYLSSILAK